MKDAIHYTKEPLLPSRDSNPNSADQNRFTTIRRGGNKVGKVGLEPTTPRVSGECSNQLSYIPIKVERVGLEPNISDFSDQRELTICATSPWLPI